MTELPDGHYYALLVVAAVFSVTGIVAMVKCDPEVSMLKTVMSTAMAVFGAILIAGCTAGLIL